MTNNNFKIKENLSMHFSQFHTLYKAKSTKKAITLNPAKAYDGTVSEVQCTKLGHALGIRNYFLCTAKPPREPHGYQRYRNSGRGTIANQMKKEKTTLMSKHASTCLLIDVVFSFLIFFVGPQQFHVMTLCLLVSL